LEDRDSESYGKDDPAKFPRRPQPTLEPLAPPNTAPLFAKTF
jgi:hypothetical protein